MRLGHGGLAPSGSVPGLRPGTVPPLPSRWGWTLVELLVGLGIFALVATAVYTALQVGISAWRRLDSGAEGTQELRVALDRMAADLRNSFPSRGMEETLWTRFEGLADRTTFSSLVLTSDPDSKKEHRRPAMIRYAVEDGVLNRWISYNLKKDADKEYWEEPQVWAQGVASIGFRYPFKKPVTTQGELPYEWKDQWPIPENLQEPAKIPRLVEITVSVGTQKVRTVVELSLGELGTS